MKSSLASSNGKLRQPRVQYHRSRVLLAKYIFLHEITNNDKFDVADLINRDFFAEVWLSLIAYNKCTVQSNITRGMRQRIGLRIYLQINGYQQPWFMFAQKSSIYEGIKIYNACALNAHMKFGNHLRLLYLVK